MRVRCSKNIRTQRNHFLKRAACALDVRCIEQCADAAADTFAEPLEPLRRDALICDLLNETARDVDV